MEYVAYFIFGIIAFFMFVPKTGTTEIRNLPILITILVIIVGVILFKLLKRVILLIKIKKLLKNHGVKIIKTRFNPVTSRFHGRYGVTFQLKDKTVNALLLTRKRKYRRYHFESIENLEFYRSNRVVFKSTKIQGATMSNLVETKRVGKQKLSWDIADYNIVVFDKLPDHITDSKTKNPLGIGDKICGTETYIADIESFVEYVSANDC